MTDRELLELAAKAAGLKVSEIIGATVRIELEERDIGGGWIQGGNVPWNPLTDDGDALRLAVKMHFEVDVGVMLTGVNGMLDSQKNLAIERHCPDPFAATRRAIVRAAAEIGKAMK